jgi:uncharacterized protein YcbK (DUF882 family)
MFESLLFFIASPGQKISNWQAPQKPGIYRLINGTSALVGDPLIPLNQGDEKVSLSKHFRIKDFMCKDGSRAIAISPKLVEKLEALIDNLGDRGYRCTTLKIMSGFRSSRYNQAIGNKTIRSRHIHGDAADVLASDFNRDGRVDRQDADVLYRSVRLLDANPQFTGGAAIYPPTRSHGWFVHTDTRGYRAAW